MLTEYLLLISTNLIFQSSRTYNSRAIAREDTFTVVWSSLVVKLSWMISTAIGIKSVFDGDLWLAATYLLTGVLGDYIGMRLTYNYKNKNI
jgi:hypothetical protein